jgi:hypothetical protein
MALTVTNNKSISAPVRAGVTDVFVDQISVNVGTPYATGGIVIAPADISANCTTIIGIVFTSVSLDGTVAMNWDSGNTKIMAFDTTSASAEYGAVDLSAAAKTCEALVMYI